MRWWKVLGLAGMAGVAATGVVVARAERHRRAYAPDEIRARLHSRLADAGGSESQTGPGTASTESDDHPSQDGRIDRDRLHLDTAE